MIPYENGSFGVKLIFRIHGSAVFRAFVPACVSTGIWLGLYFGLSIETKNLFGHPYPIGALFAALTFLLTFRAGFAYNRYWEAFTAVHTMHSKFLDVAIDLAAFHCQAECYDQFKPPTFGAHPEIRSVRRERERENEQTLEELKEDLQDIADAGDELIGTGGAHSSLRTKISNLPLVGHPFSKRNLEARKKMREKKKLQQKMSRPLPKSIEKVKTKIPLAPPTKTKPTETSEETASAKPRSPFSLFSGWAGSGKDSREDDDHTQQKSQQTPPATLASSTTNMIVSSNVDHPRAWDPSHPPLFLQESVHLLSLLSAVAMSTLRVDLEEADAPLSTFTPGQPWPHVDPDSYHAENRLGWAPRHKSCVAFQYLFGQSRTPFHRTLYNAARPFRVIGGVSDGEVMLLRAARGPQAKTALAHMWLTEFISREYLAGSTGKVAPPIISRLYQFSSDGMLWYHQARKIAYIPYPFPHAQITSLFVFVLVGFCPVLMLAYVYNIAMSIVLNFVTVVAFAGLNEVARELEAPFTAIPNEVPLNNFQAQFNEALITVFAGYHPDAYWEVCVEADYPPARPPKEVQPTTEQEKVESDEGDDKGGDEATADAQEATEEEDTKQQQPEVRGSEASDKAVAFSS